MYMYMYMLYVTRYTLYVICYTLYVSYTLYGIWYMVYGICICICIYFISKEPSSRDNIHYYEASILLERTCDLWSMVH
jgi:hypothetical protein